MKNLKKLGLMLFVVASVALSTMAAPVAKPTESKVLVNGVSKSFDAYSINDNNYFKLRDLAFVLNGTEKQFEVTWDGSKNAINMLSGKAYTVTNTELTKGDGKAKDAKLNTSAIYIDGQKVNLTAYTIGESNYFKLRDVMQAFNVGLGWDGAANTITIDTTVPYEAAASAPAPAPAPVVDEVKEIEIPMVIKNRTGFDIYWLYMSPVDVDDWEEDILGEDDILPMGDDLDLTLTTDTDTLEWDMQIKDADEYYIDFYGLDFSDYTDGCVLTLGYDMLTDEGIITINGK